MVIHLKKSLHDGKFSLPDLYKPLSEIPAWTDTGAVGRGNHLLSLVFTLITGAALGTPFPTSNQFTDNRCTWTFLPNPLKGMHGPKEVIKSLLFPCLRNSSRKLWSPGKAYWWYFIPTRSLSILGQVWFGWSRNSKIIELQILNFSRLVS